MAGHAADEVLALLRAQRFDELVGRFETEDLECKRVPYRLEQDDQKFELAKDVASLANAGGGVLLIGVATRKSPSHSDDEIERIAPFSKTLFNATQVRAVIAAWTCPSLDEVEIEAFEAADDASKILAALRVPAVAREAGPVLVTRTLNEHGKRVDVLFGLFERKRSHVAHLDARQLQQLIRDGRRIETLLHEEFASLRSEIADLRGSNPPAPPIDQATIDARIANAAQAGGLGDLERIVLIGVPARPLDLQALFESRTSRLSQLIEHPPEIRDAGFNLSAGGDSTIVNGLARRSVWQGSNLLEVYRDGMAVFLWRADSSGLCWAAQQRGQQPLLINQMALVEPVYLFARFLSELYKEELSNGQAYELRARLESRAEGPRFTLQEGRMRRFATSHRTAPDRACEVKTQVRVGVDAPGQAAFRLLVQLYAWFGADGDVIPFVSHRGSGQPEVDPAKMINE